MSVEEAFMFIKYRKTQQKKRDKCFTNTFLVRKTAVDGPELSSREVSAKGGKIFSNGKTERSEGKEHTLRDRKMGLPLWLCPGQNQPGPAG